MTEKKTRKDNPKLQTGTLIHVEDTHFRLYHYYMFTDIRNCFQDCTLLTVYPR